MKPMVPFASPSPPDASIPYDECRYICKVKSHVKSRVCHRCHQRNNIIRRSQPPGPLSRPIVVMTDNHLPSSRRHICKVKPHVKGRVCHRCHHRNNIIRPSTVPRIPQREKRPIVVVFDRGCRLVTHRRNAEGEIFCCDARQRLGVYLLTTAYRTTIVSKSKTSCDEYETSEAEAHHEPPPPRRGGDDHPPPSPRGMHICRSTTGVRIVADSRRQSHLVLRRSHLPVSEVEEVSRVGTRRTTAGGRRR